MDHCLPETTRESVRETTRESAGTGTPWITRAAGAIRAAAGEVRAGLSRAAMNRRVVHRLSRLSDRELKDIGLCRQDVADAGVPGTRDAVGLLVGRRDARRHVRAAARGW